MECFWCIRYTFHVRGIRSKNGDFTSNPSQFSPLAKWPCPNLHGYLADRMWPQWWIQNLFQGKTKSSGPLKLNRASWEWKWTTKNRNFWLYWCTMTVLRVKLSPGAKNFKGTKKGTFKAKIGPFGMVLSGSKRLSQVTWPDRCPRREAWHTVRWKGSEASLQVKYVTRKLTSWWLQKHNFF